MVAVGFNAQAMRDAPWTIIVDGTGKVSERKLADQSSGRELAPSVKIVLNRVADGRRTVMLSRPLKGKTPDYYTFTIPGAAPASRPTDGKCSVALTQQVSKSTCVLGKTFGCYGNGTMWTSGGCRGVFTCDTASGVQCNTNGRCSTGMEANGGCAGTRVCDCSGHAPSSTQLPFINAVGSGPTLAYHKVKGPSSLSLIPVEGDGVSGACVCAVQPAPFGRGQGKLVYVRTGEKADIGTGTVSFRSGTGSYNNCINPSSFGDHVYKNDMLAMKNPSCDVRAYTGGQTACHHMWSLLDSDQPIPWPDQPLEYQLKFRFWVQPYNASYHTQVWHQSWGMGTPVEYDVPKCGPGVMGCQQQPDGNWVHTIRATYTGAGRLIVAHFHCHAPTCLSMAMYRCGKQIKPDDCNEHTGELLCEERPVYGGTGRLDRMD